MKTILDSISSFFTGASGPLRCAVVSLIASALVLRFPDVINWLGEPVAGGIARMAAEIRDWAWSFILLFAKQVNATGGSKPATKEANARVVDSQSAKDEKAHPSSQ